MKNILPLLLILGAIIISGCVHYSEEEYRKYKPIIEIKNSFYCTNVFEESFLQSSRCDSFFDNEYWMLGTIMNIGPEAIGSIKVSYTFYDENGTIVDSGKKYLYPFDSIPPNQQIPFKIQLDLKTNKFRDYKLDLVYDVIWLCPPNNNLDSSNVKMRKIENELVLSGEIINSGNDCVEYVDVAIGIYDDGGKMIDLLYTDVNPDKISNGEIGSFIVKETYSDNGLEKIDNYKLWIQGRECL